MTFVLILITHFAAGGMTPEPPSRECVAVIVLNRHRRVDETWDKRGRPVVRYSETWWWSAWDRPFGPWSPPGTWIGRGWWRADAGRLVRCSDGWMLAVDGGDVVAPEIWIISSPFDWEVRHRTVTIPLFRK